MSIYTRVGGIVSAVYLAAILIVLYFNWTDAQGMGFSGWGEFIGGTMSPLAIIWVVMGYLQQGAELRTNSKSLMHQQEQLERQVNEIANLVMNAERQAGASEQLVIATRLESEEKRLKEIADSQPVIRCRTATVTSGSGFSSLDIENAGASVSDISLECSEPDIEISIDPKNVFEEDGKGRLNFRSSRYPFRFTMKYTDRRGRPGSQLLEMVNSGYCRPVVG